MPEIDEIVARVTWRSNFKVKWSTAKVTRLIYRYFYKSNMQLHISSDVEHIVGVISNTILR